MHGTWKVTGFSLVPLLVLVVAGGAGVEAAGWLLARTWWILGSLAACGVAAAFLAPGIARRVDGGTLRAWVRETGVTADAPLFMSAPRPAAELPRTERPAIAPVIINFYDTPAAERATIIRTAITGSPGDAITEE